MFENDAFQQLLRDYPDAVFDHTKFKGFLNDVFPEDRSLRRLLLHLHELGIQDELYGTGVITNILAHRFTRLLVEDYGISEENARLGVYTWCICYGKNILGKPCELNESHTEFVSDSTQPKSVGKKNLQFNPLRKIASALKVVSTKNKVPEDADDLPCDLMEEVPIVDDEKVAKPLTEAEAVGEHEKDIDKTEAKLEEKQIAANVEDEENEVKVFKTENDKPVEEPVKKEKVDKLSAVPSAVRTINRPFKDSRVWQPPPPPPVVPPIEEVSSPTINLPPDVMSQVIKARNHCMPLVPELEGADVDEDVWVDVDMGESAGAGTDTAVQEFAAVDVKPEKIEEPKYTFPPIDLLSRGTAQSRAGNKEVELNSERLEAAFLSFGLNVSITNATRGPSFTRYEVELEAGIRLSRLTNMASDIALSLGVENVNIATVPGKIATVGIDVPNKNTNKVHLRDIIKTNDFVKAQSKLAFAIGKDSISGDTIVGDMKQLTHLLITGTTGSGKTALLNSIIMSVLFRAKPDEVRLILISPNTSEFAIYERLPHLIVPVITDVNKAVGALQWLVFEVMKRYNVFAETGVRDIEGYNRVAKKSNEEFEPLPQVVVAIDELADIMLTAKNDAEESICRIAQMGHIAGIHLVISTQTSRTNVVPELMKSKLNSRLSFRVQSAYDSRYTLGVNGAEKLNGNGDMLYAPIGAVKPMRVQGAWVSDSEREEVVKHIKKISATNYDDEATHEIEKDAYNKNSSDISHNDTDDEPEHDEFLAAAVDIILETGQASVSMIQRRLKLGYARAARIIDQMEEMGIVGPYEGSKPRTLLIDKNQWRQMQYSTGTAPVDREVEW